MTSCCLLAVEDDENDRLGLMRRSSVGARGLRVRAVAVEARSMVHESLAKLLQSWVQRGGQPPTGSASLGLVDDDDDDNDNGLSLARTAGLVHSTRISKANAK